ncbi:hypothetical protein AGMMS49587_11130 [Spirochaetia bacterium]|nr:hypothetical protein AGMMS49587_11130 [Spirochaetia bacterium]
MKALICDVCGHVIQQPQPGVTYFHFAHRDLCEPCQDQLQLILKPITRSRQPFNYEWYNQLVQDSIETAIEKGKFN